MLEKLLKKHSKGTIFTALGAIIVFILIGAANGILGEIGIKFSQWLVEGLTQLRENVSWIWMITTLILLVALITVVIIWRHTDYYLTTANKIVDFDDRLQRLLPNLVSATDLDVEMQRLMYLLLQHATALFDDTVHRASVFLPDAGRKELRIKYSYQLSQETVNRTVFNIELGNASTKRGIAGEAFLDEEGIPQVVHLSHDKGKWKSDREGSYITFDANRPSVPYQSCVCIPISGSKSLADRLGVVCFDSQSSSIFDSSQIEDSELQKRVITLSARFAAALQMYKELQATQKSQQQKVGPLST